MKRFFEELKSIVASHPDYTEGDFEIKFNMGFETLWLCNNAVIRAIYQKNEDHLEVVKKYFQLFGLGEPDSNASWIRITMSDQVANTIFYGAKSVFKQCYKDSAEYTFGCCSRFIECSDAKKCTCKKEHDYKNAKRFPSGCLYKDNLEQGLIFYGKNKNYPS